MKKKILILVIIALFSAIYVKSQPCTPPVKNDGLGVLGIVPKYFGPSCTVNSQITDNVDVSIGSGNFDISNAVKAYMIYGNPVLWHNNNTTSINVGVGAGAYPNTLNYCTFVGYNAGNQNHQANAYENTFVGSLAGAINSDGSGCSYFGAWAGMNN